MTHLLVVDDEVSILELIKNSLGKDGYLITVCQNADDVDIKNENAINKSNKGKSLVTLIFLSQSEVKKP